jgi:hypothetical protein
LTTEDIVEMLRERACQAGEPWTGDAPEEDHGHTDCWLHHQSANEIECLRAENKKLAGYLLHGLVFVHERLIEELDEVLQPYFGESDV